LSPALLLGINSMVIYVCPMLPVLII